MIVIEQLITDFTASNIPETYNEYNPATTYTYENYTSLTNDSTVRKGFYYYRSLTTGNIGNDPELTEGKYWTKIGISNRKAMLDQESLSKSESTSDIVVEYIRGSKNALALGYIEATSLKIEYLDLLDIPIPEYTQIISLVSNKGITDFVKIIYVPYQVTKDYMIYLPLKRIGKKIRITLVPLVLTGYARCGFLVSGIAIDMGATSDGVPIAYQSYSIVERDVWGKATINKRAIQKEHSFNTYIDKALFASTQKDIISLYDKIVCFVIDESDLNLGFENLVTLGNIQKATPTAERKNKNIITWSVIESL